MFWLVEDLRSAWRQLARRRSLTLISLATLGLGIGVTTTSFSILQETTFQLLPFPDAETLVVLEGIDRSTGRKTQISYPDLVDLVDGSTADSKNGDSKNGAAIEAAMYRNRTMVFESEDRKDPVAAAEVSSQFFDVLGVKPAPGRAFAPDDADVSALPAVVLSHDFHARHFAGDPDVVGRVISLTKQDYGVIGVVQEHSAFPSNVDVWIPLRLDPQARRDDRSLSVIARRSSSLEPLRATLDLISRRLAADHPETNQGWAAIATPLRKALGSKHKDAARALLVVSGLTLFLACLNLANLLLAHASARRHELALRSALGAKRLRIVHLLVTESCLLALGGAALGLLVAQWGLAAFETFMGAPEGASWMRFELDAQSLTFAVLVALAAGLTFGVVCSLQLSEIDLKSSLREGATGAGSGIRGRRFRQGLVVGQLALSLTMVVGAASVVASSLRLSQIDTGFDRDGLVALHTDLDDQLDDHLDSQVDSQGIAQRTADVASIRSALARLPGVDLVTVTSHAPLIDRQLTYLTVVTGSSGGSDAALPPVATRFVDADFHRVLGIPILRGRSFEPHEARDPSSRKALVNQSLAQVLWPGLNPIGQRLKLGHLNGLSDLDGPGPWFTIIGVAGSVSERQLAAPSGHQLTLPYVHGKELSFVVRPESTPSPWIEAARDVLGESGHTVLAVRTMDEAMQWYERDRRLQGGVLGALGVVALLLGMLGIYGTMALMVSEQTREIGVRIALGSGRGAILRWVLTKALSLTALGIACGLPLVLGFGLVLSSIFSEVRLLDPLPTLAVAALLAGAALAATYRPARQASQVDPILAIRAD